MDLWSFLFYVMLTGFILYFCVGVMWTIRYFFESYPTPVFLAGQFPGLGLAMFIMMIVPTIMLVLHITNVITMWEVGYALAKL